MDRRDFLGLVAGAQTSLAGCAVHGGIGAPVAGGDQAIGESASPSEQQPSSQPPVATQDAAEPLAGQGTPPNICKLPHVNKGIKAVAGPAFGPDWSTVPAEDREPYGSLDDEVMVIVVERDDRARAYPVPVLWYHEVVNDRFEGPLLVTYWPVCRNGVVAERAVADETTRFGVTGRRWRPPETRIRNSAAEGRTFAVSERKGTDKVAITDRRNLVMYDVATNSYWSQLLVRSICGSRRGERLSIVPSTTMTYREWQRHTDGTGEVLLPPPHSEIGNP